MNKTIKKIGKVALGLALGSALIYGAPTNSYAQSNSLIGNQGIVNPSANGQTGVVNQNSSGNCSDGINNDKDGKIDRNDPDCYANKNYNPDLNEDGSNPSDSGTSGDGTQDETQESNLK